eukprot:TRINITY_DN8462_c1_g3_i1.p1 TRINITY_DN8462_c1_g3~~TRINITY_DN8462_c1_g3_i1.p1  ORF type:complete len:460 (+),score=74.27 TRINITY_DN8462_c1_g3_i1:65-1381(+)
MASMSRRTAATSMRRFKAAISAALLRGNHALESCSAVAEHQSSARPFFSSAPRSLPGTSNLQSSASSVMKRSSSSSSSIGPQLPTLRYDQLISDPEAFAQELGSACRVADGGAGIFLIAGLPASLQKLNEDLLEAARSFFALSQEEKALLDYSQSPEFRGYMWQGAENTAGRIDEREQIEFGREELRPDAERAEDEQGQPLYNRLRGPNQWPQTPPSLRPLMETWLREMEDLSMKLTHALAISVGLDASAFDDLFRQPHIQAKLVHYPTPPTVADDVQGEESLGVGAHSDSGFLTLLLQDGVGGLEALDATGRWVAADPIPGSVVCNLGEVIQLLTGGIYPSTVHRVRRPSSTAAQGRLSAPFFWNPSLGVVVEPVNMSGSVASLVGRPSEIENRMLRSYGMNAFKSLARSHPKIFARHHPDLECLPDGQVVLRKIQP